jgi:hypothetical protein
VGETITTQLQGILSMTAVTGGKIKFGVWGLIVGAIFAIIIGFVWGGWTTASTTQSMSEEAVLESQAGICIAQFINDANYEEKLKEFEKVDSWNRAKFVEKGGWDIMPGQEKADYRVARACSDAIGLLIKK